MMQCEKCNHHGHCMLNNNSVCEHFEPAPKRYRIDVQTIEEVVAQVKILLANNYLVGIVRHDNLFGDCIKYTLTYQSMKEANNNEH